MHAWNRRARAVLCLTALFVSAPAFAVRPGPSAGADAQRFGKNLGVKPFKRAPTAAALKALADFRRREGAAAVRFSPRTGLPESLSRFKAKARAGTPEQAARALLRDVRGFMGVDESELTLSRSIRRHGLDHLLFEQTRGGVPVFGARVKVHQTTGGEAILVQSSYEPPFAAPSAPSVSRERARQAVLAELPGAQVGAGALNYYPDPSDAKLRLAWRFEAASGNPPGLWVVLVDAVSAEVLLRYDRLDYAACLASGTVAGLVYPIDPTSVGGSGLPVVRPLANERVWVGSYVDSTTTDSTGFYCHATQAGKVFSGLKGPYASVYNHEAAPAHYDNGGGLWFTANLPISSPHPYTDDLDQTLSVTVPLPAGGTFAKVMPHFSQFNVGVITSGGSGPSEFVDWTDDDYVEVRDPAGNPLGAMSGARSPFLGPAVENLTYQVRLRTNDAGTAYGYDVDVSSFLVLPSGNSPGVSVGPSSTFTWVGGSPLPSGIPGVQAPTFDNSLSEINVFYQINQVHDFFRTTVDAQGLAAINAPLPVTVKFGPGLLNAFYNPVSRGLFIGDGGVTPGDGPFALDATVIHHEYTHFVVDTIYPIINFGQSGAISEANADYFSASSFAGQGLNTATEDGLPQIGQYVNQALLGSYSALPNNDGTTRDLDGTAKVFPGQWFGEIHTDSMFVSQSLWSLRKKTSARYLGQTSNATACGSGPCYKADVVAFGALFFFPESFQEYLEAALIVSNQAALGFVAGDSVTVQGAFSDHGILTAPQGGDAYEPNDGIANATDVSTMAAVVATIFPAGDIDAYALPAAPGSLRATLDLPPNPSQAGTYSALQMTLVDVRGNVLASASPTIDINPDAGGFCPTSGNCFTSAPSISFSVDASAAGQLYVLVSAAGTSLGSNAPSSSLQPYTLRLSYSPVAVVAANTVGAAFDSDLISFSVGVTSFTSPYYVFDHAQLRDQSLNVVPQTATNGAGSFLTFVSSAAPAGSITGQVRLASGFAARFPALGTVELELFGKSELGAVHSLGLSAPLSLSTNIVAFKAYNNVFNPKLGQRATLRYDLGAAGSLTIKLYSMNGSLVKTLFDGPVPAGKGSVDWWGVNDRGSTVASGVYLAHIIGPGIEQTQKIVVVK